MTPVLLSFPFYFIQLIFSFRIYPAHVAQPLLMSYLMFRQPLSEEVSCHFLNIPRNTITNINSTYLSCTTTPTTYQHVRNRNNNKSTHLTRKYSKNFEGFFFFFGIFSLSPSLLTNTCADTFKYLKLIAELEKTEIKDRAVPKSGWSSWWWRSSNTPTPTTTTPTASPPPVRNRYPHNYLFYLKKQKTLSDCLLVSTCLRCRGEG